MAKVTIYFMVGSKCFEKFGAAMEMMRATREPVIVWEERRSFFFRKTTRVVQIIWR